MKKQEFINVVVVEPNELPYIKKVQNELDPMKEIVGGWLETCFLGSDIVLVCNEEGKLMNLPPNRVVSNDVIVGTFFICGLDRTNGEFVSLDEHDTNLVMDDFSRAVIMPKGV